MYRALIWLVLAGLAGGSAGCKKAAVAALPAPPVQQTNNLPTQAQPKLPTIKLYLGAETLDSEMALTPLQEETGMMYRTNIQDTDAMIFVLPYTMQASFWMTNCPESISCAYITPDGTIQEIHHLEANDATPVLSATADIRFVLETSDGWFARHHVGTNTVITTERGPLPDVFAQLIPMKIALAQLNPTVGDFAGNAEKILAAYRRGAEAGADIVITSELCLTGYPPRDLLLRQDFVARNLEALERLATATGKTGLLVGFVGENKKRPGRPVTNSVALLQNGKIVATRSKTLLPTYDVFDEDRYFQPAPENAPVEFNGQKIGLTICEDIWNDEDFWPERRYRSNPPADLAGAGAEIIFNLSASPWHLGKNRTRHEMLRSIAKKTGRPVVFSNQVGGNDELIFDGCSLVFDAQGGLVAQGKLFEEDLVMAELPSAGKAEAALPCDEELVYRALVLGIRDYLRKCGFKSAVLGLSGGIDSALVACLAVAALGKENVHGISLPSQYSSQGSLDDAAVLARNLGIPYDVVPIQPMFEQGKAQLKKVFAGKPEDVAEENMQARIRGTLLMALSNKFGSLLLTTGNKSEMAVGYCTLYGDMNGGLAVINDVPKMMVYRISRWINREREIIPPASITKPPSAELRPDQTDQDSLPPYEILDDILEAYVVNGKSPRDIIKAGFDEATVKRVVRLIDISEYKRRQAVPGLKVTTKAFGVGWRVPVAQKFRE